MILKFANIPQKSRIKSKIPAFYTVQMLVVLHGGGGVHDGGTQVGHDVLDGLGGVGHHIEDVLHVLAGQLIQPESDRFCGLCLFADILGLERTAVHLHDVFSSSSSR